MDKSIINRFWLKVDKTDTCWNWTASLIHSGYGRFTINGITWSAHRVSWIIHNGNIPKDNNYCGTMFVLHKCDNPKCVNPDHLFIGTCADNHKDMVKKGRAPIGETVGTSRFTDTQIRVIRTYYPAITQMKLAEIFGTQQSAISKIILRKTWKHV